TAGVGSPTFTNRSVGTKLVIYPNIGASNADNAIGAESTGMWYSVSGASNVHNFYCGTTLNATIGNGIANIPVTTQLATNSNALNATSGSLTLNGDLHMYNGTKNTIVFSAAGGGAPSFTNRSVGTKIVLFPNISAGTV